MNLKFNGFRSKIFLRFQFNSKEMLDECQIWTCNYSRWRIVCVKRLDWVKGVPCLKPKRGKKKKKKECFYSGAFLEFLEENSTNICAVWKNSGIF